MGAYDKLRSNDGAAKHSGDNTSGSTHDNEVLEYINVDLDKVSPDVEHLFITVHVYSASATFSSVDSAFIRLFDTSDGTDQVLCSYVFDERPVSRGIVFAKLHRTKDTNRKNVGWAVAILTWPCEGNVATSDSTKKFVLGREFTPPPSAGAPPVSDATAAAAAAAISVAVGSD